MKSKDPGFFQIIRAPFLSSILAPLLFGTLLAVSIQDEFSVPGFVLVLVLGIGLHIATNVYNDIYDTLQGTDTVNRHRNEFSGGSGIMMTHPHLTQRMYWIARGALVVAFLATIGLTFFVQKSLWPLLWGLYLLSAFFSKFYTAAPVKLAYRGLGEISVWFAFGPMAILVAAVSQNVGWHPTILLAMAPSGISTLSILLIGQMIDLEADAAAGKRGIAARQGLNATRYLYGGVHLVLFINILLLSLQLPAGWPILISLIPYVLLFPKIWRILGTGLNDPNQLKQAAGFNVQLHLLFSGLLVVGLVLHLWLS